VSSGLPLRNLGFGSWCLKEVYKCVNLVNTSVLGFWYSAFKRGII
jgi:hypothetical protein